MRALAKNRQKNTYPTESLGFWLYLTTLVNNRLDLFSFPTEFQELCHASYH